MNELISIIVPVYNAEKTLRRCVDSLTGQTYQNIEILLVNDGSKDGSLQLCREYAEKDERIRVIDKENGGVSSARNAGLDAARGKWVMFCDSDDWADIQWCGCMRENFVPGDLTVCEIWREDVPCETHPEPMEIDQRKYYLHHPMLMCAPYNKIFDREVLEANHIRFQRELSLGEDFVFCLTYLGAISGKVRFVYRNLYYYDTTNENSLSRRAPALEQCDRFYREVTAAMEKLGADDPESIQTRNRFVAPHFERFLTAAAARTELSVSEKMAIAGKVQTMESFLATCRGIRWGNPAYLWLYNHAHLKTWMLYRILLSYLKKGK